MEKRIKKKKGRKEKKNNGKREEKIERGKGKNDYK